ncbi:MAG TPA: hypothetical protein PKK06_01000 [Phycisphaerae bacterium]|nr:hypothetical protein [Phycisphaerae bacterium]
MPVIALRRVWRKVIGLAVDVRFHKRAERRSFPFAVDTGAERTFICPHYESILRGAFPNFKPGTDAKPVQSILGELEMRTAPGVDLYAICCDRQEVKLNEEMCCVAGRSLRHGFEAGSIRINILGWDILRQWALCWNPIARTSFLATPGDYINTQHPVLEPYFSSKAPVGVGQAE